MWRIGAAFAAGLIGLSACAQPGGTSSALPGTSAAAARYESAARTRPGRIHIEPFAIAFRSWKSPPQVVRVWQDGFEGSYRALYNCSGITVAVVKYTRHHESIWNVWPNHWSMRLARTHRESCLVRFEGASGQKGRDNLQVEVRR